MEHRKVTHDTALLYFTDYKIKKRANVHRKRNFSAEFSKGRLCHYYGEIENILKENSLDVKFLSYQLAD